MTLKQYKDYFKTSFKWDEAISIGKIDSSKEKAICFYNSDRMLSPIKAINNSTYKIKPIAILLRYSKNQNTAEEMALSIYEFFDERYFNIDGKQILSRHVYSEPNNLGTDDENVYEYSIELEMIER